MESEELLTSSHGIYGDGPLPVCMFAVHSAGAHARGEHGGKNGSGRTEVKLPKGDEPPLPLLIAAPEDPGIYPVLVFQHGFSMRNYFYSQLLKQVASHGFVAVTPQMYRYFSGSDAMDEIRLAGKVIDWMPAHLTKTLSKCVASVEPDLSKLALAGHSRGGKVAFGLATGVCRTSLKFSAIAGLDPVDGMDAFKPTSPPILKFKANSLKMGIPTLIIGAGLSVDKKNWLFPACAPEGVNHAAFFYESNSPAFHFVATDHGHMDFMDDDTGGLQGWLSFHVSRNGSSREPLRRFSAGILVAFLKAALMQDKTEFSSALLNPERAPVKLAQPQTLGGW